MPRSWLYRYGILAAVALMASVARADDMETLIARFTSELLGSRSCGLAGSYLSSQKADGSWGDIDYADKSKASWDLYKHTDRLLEMAVAYRKPGSSHYQSPAMLSAIEKGLSYWNARNPTTPNAYDRAIGAPMKLGEILVLTRGGLSAGVQAGTIDYMDYVVLSNGYSRYGPGGGLETGADVARAAYVHMTIGMTGGHSADIATAGGRIQDQAKVVTKKGQEGLRSDGSYHYHGAQLYTPWYAQSHYEGTAKWARLLTGTQWQFGDGTQTFLRKGVLEGMAWMARRGQWDPFVSGRGLAMRDNQDVNIDWVADLKLSDETQAARYQAFIDHNKGVNDGAVVGNKFFSQSDYMSHRRAEFMMSVRMISNRTENQETGNDQNIRNRWLTQGTTAILIDGDEYKNIQPVWDWRRIPGTTASSTSKLRTNDWGLLGKTAFVGGASDGINGVAAMDLRAQEQTVAGVTPEVTGKKSWFLFGNTMVALGAGINYSGTSAPVVTTVNQCVKQGDVISSTGGVVRTEALTTTTDGRSLAGGNWVWHDQVGYVFPGGQNVFLKNETGVSGDWAGISPGSYTAGQAVETQDRFTLMIDHGTPQNAQYAYMVVAGQSRAQFEQQVGQMQIEIVSNTPSLAAVCDARQKLSGAVFYNHGVADFVRLHPNLALRVTENLLVMIDESGALPLVTMSSPTATALGDITFYRTGLTDVRAGGMSLAAVASGDDWRTVTIPSGVTSLELVAAPIPEPVTLITLSLGGLALLGRR